METGGLMPAKLSIPAMPAVTGGAENYANRMAATGSLSSVANGNAMVGGKRMKRKTVNARHRNNVTKVMKGCNSKKTKRHNKKKRHGKRIFRGGDNIELTMPGGSSPFQVDTLKNLTGGLFAAQTAAANVAPLPTTPVVSNFAPPPTTPSNLSGGGLSRRRHRNTKYKRLRYKKSIGRKSRSYRQSRRH